MENDELCINYISLIFLFAGQFGIARPFYFPFTKSYWCGSYQETNKVFAENQESQTVYQTAHTVEMDQGR